MDNMCCYAILIAGTFLATASAAIPSEYAMELAATGDWESVTDVPLGSVVTLKLTIDVPAETSGATFLELLSSVITTRFAIGNILGVAKGSNVQISNSNWETPEVFNASENDEPGIFYKTRAVFDFGTVTNNQGSNDLAENQITIDYEAIYTSEGGQTPPDSIQTSAGMELMDGSRIIISMLTFNSQQEETKTGDSSFDVTGPTEITPLEVGTATLTFRVPNVSVPATVSVSNYYGKVIVKEIVGNWVGSAFDLYVYPTLIGKVNNDTCQSPDVFSLYLGTLINTNAMRNGPDTSTYDIAVDIKMTVADLDTVGTVVYPSLTVELGGQELYKTTLNMTVKDPPVFQTLQSMSLTPTATVAIAKPGILTLTLTTHPNNIHTATITISAAPKSGAPRVLSIIAVNPSSYGANVCPIRHEKWNVTLSSTMNDEIKDNGLIEFEVANLGEDAGIDDEFTIDVVVMATDGSENDLHDVSVTVSDLTTNTAEVTQEANETYPTHVNYNISIAPLCSEAVYEPANIATFNIRVETEPDVTAGPFSMEAPIPPETVSDLAMVKLTATKVGANVPCMPYGELPVEFSDWVENSGENDRGVIELPMMCNKNISDDPEDNVIEIEAQFRIKHVANQSEVRNNTLGGGIRYSESQVWVVVYHLLSNKPQTYATTKMITAINVPDQYMPATGWPGDVVIQWSPDDDTYYDYKQKWGAITENGNWKIELARPLFARYVRVTNTNGRCMKDHTYDVKDAFPMYGSNTKNVNFMQSVHFFLDSDYDTCIDLPLTSETDLTPFMWVELPKPVFGIKPGATAFKVKVIGEGIQCHSRVGPQVTYVTFPSDPPTSSFQGKKLLCDHTSNSTLNAGKIQCEYECACAGADQCSQMSLFMMHTGTAPSSYKLCEVEMELN